MRLCADCRMPIPEARLKAIPSAVLCTRCVLGAGDEAPYKYGEEPSKFDALTEDFLVDMGDEGVYEALDSPNPNPIFPVSPGAARMFLE